MYHYYIKENVVDVTFMFRFWFAWREEQTRIYLSQFSTMNECKENLFTA